MLLKQLSKGNVFKNSLLFSSIKCIFLFLIFTNSFNSVEIKELMNKIFPINQYNSPKIYPLNEFFNNSNKTNSILIFEPFNYHYECTPGYSKYFIELGFSVDIIMNEIGLTAFSIFEQINKIRIFFYKNIQEIKEFAEYFSFTFIKYDYILVQTTEPKEYKLYKNFNLFNINHSFFVFHHLDFVNYKKFSKLVKNRIWSLGNFSSAIQVNPHYFGKIKRRKKNKITKFFITSTKNRRYQFLISAAETIKNNNLKFHVIVVGKWNAFSEDDLSYNIKNHFTFKYRISYTELYQEVSDSDYIIINLDPDNIEDNEFKNIRVTGSAQLAYGFLKPVLINKEFANIYNFNSNNSFIFESSNFIQVMKDAINQENQDYEKMQTNLFLLSNNIFINSLNNMKNCFTNL